ncbi:MAG: DUF6702 family protein [Flavobacteriaceae bacterium]
MYKNKIFIHFFWVIVVFPLISFTHEYYVSITEVVYVSEKHQLQLTTRVFTDDMEAYFNSQTNENIQLSPDHNPILIDALVERFFQNNFKVFFDNNKLEISYLGRQYQEDQMLIFAEVTELSPPTSYRIQNTILIPFRTKQQNIVRVKNNITQKSFLMNASKTILNQLWIN